MPHFEPHHSSSNPAADPFDGSVPEVPPELGQLLQQLFVALEDYMNGPFQAMANIASLELECRSVVAEIGETLRAAHWTVEDTLLLLNECVRRLKLDHRVSDLEARAARLTAQFPVWVTGA